MDEGFAYMAAFITVLHTTGQRSGHLNQSQAPHTGLGTANCSGPVPGAYPPSFFLPIYKALTHWPGAFVPLFFCFEGVGAVYLS